MMEERIEQRKLLERRDEPWKWHCAGCGRWVALKEADDIFYRAIAMYEKVHVLHAVLTCSHDCARHELDRLNGRRRELP